MTASPSPRPAHLHAGTQTPSTLRSPQRVPSRVPGPIVHRQRAIVLPLSGSSAGFHPSLNSDVGNA